MLVGETPRFVFQFEPATSEQIANIEAKWAAAAEAEKRLLLDATKPGTIYRGTVTTRRDSKREEFLLHFVEASQGKNELKAYLEHPEQPLWRRRLVGRLQLNPDLAKSYPIQLNTTGVATKGKEMRNRSFLDTRNEHLRLQLDGSALVSGPGNYQYHFERVSPEMTAQLHQRDTNLRARLLAFIQPGAAHDGTVERAGVIIPGLLRLRIIKMGSHGESITAVLQSRSRSRYLLYATGEFDPFDGTLRLKWKGLPPFPALPLHSHPDLSPLFGKFQTRNGTLVLSMDGNVMSGKHSDMSFRFRPSLPERLAELQIQEADQLARALAFVQAGSVHEGTLKLSNGASGQVRLRILRMENRGAKIVARLESAQQPQFAQQFTGQLALDGLMLVARLGNAADIKGKGLFEDPTLQSFRRHFYPRRNTNIELVFTDIALEGGVRGNKLSKMTFPLR